MNTPAERLAKLHAEIERLEQQRSRLDDAGQDVERLDNLIQAKRATLEKLEVTARMLEELVKRRRSA